jgi:hypothetical protein
MPITLRKLISKTTRRGKILYVSNYDEDAGTINWTSNRKKAERIGPAGQVCVFKILDPESKRCSKHKPHYY